MSIYYKKSNAVEVFSEEGSNRFFRTACLFLVILSVVFSVFVFSSELAHGAPTASITGFSPSVVPYGGNLSDVYYSSDGNYCHIYYENRNFSSSILAANQSPIGNPFSVSVGPLYWNGLEKIYIRCYDGSGGEAYAERYIGVTDPPPPTTITTPLPAAVETGQSVTIWRQVNDGVFCNYYQNGSFESSGSQPMLGYPNASWTWSYGPMVNSTWFKTECRNSIGQWHSSEVLVTVNPPVLTVTKAGGGTGTVTSNPGGINCGTTCSATYGYNTSVTLTATSAVGSSFAGWSGGGCSGTGTCTVTMSASQNVTATFNLITYPVTYNGNGADSGFPPPDQSKRYNVNLTLRNNTSPLARTGYTFAGWNTQADGLGTPYATSSIYATNAPLTLYAKWTPNSYTLTVTTVGGGTGTVTSNPGGINCGTTCSALYAANTPVTLTATSTGGSTFAGWWGEGCSGTSTCTVTMTQARNVDAQFDAPTEPPAPSNFTWSCPKPGNQATVSWSARPTATYYHLWVYDETSADQTNYYPSAGAGDPVSVTIPTTPNRFYQTKIYACNAVGCSTTNVLLQAVICFANDPTINFKGSFETQVNQATVNIPPNPTGARLNWTSTNARTCNLWGGAYDPRGMYGVATTNLGIPVSPSVTTTYSLECWNLGSTTPFLGVSTGVQTVTMVVQPSLTVSKVGPGAGTVTSNPGGISCGTTCSAPYTLNTAVTLTATPNAGSSFAGWSGDADCSDGSVTMSAARSCIATFTQSAPTGVSVTPSSGTFGPGAQTFTTVYRDTNGATDISSVQFVINAGINGNNTAFYGWYIRATNQCFLYNSDNAGSWSPGGWGSLPATLPWVTLNSCTSSMSGNDLTVNWNLTFNTWNEVMNEYLYVEDNGTLNSGWQGSFGSITVTAPQTLTVTKAGAGAGTVTSNPGGISCGTACSSVSSSFPVSQNVTLTASSPSGSVFAGWSGDPDCADGSVTMSSDRTCIATFETVDMSQTNIWCRGPAELLLSTWGTSCNSPFNTTATTSWEISGSVDKTQCTITGNGDSWFGNDPVPPVGLKTKTLVGDTFYSLACYGTVIKQAEFVVDITPELWITTIEDPITKRNGVTVNQGDSVRLHWDTKGLPGCTLTNVPDLSPETTSIPIGGATEYTLDCGAGGSASVTVEIQQSVYES